VEQDPEHFDARVEQVVRRMRRERLDTSALVITAIASLLILVAATITLLITI
jgi:hypothetical protein